MKFLLIALYVVFSSIGSAADYRSRLMEAGNTATMSANENNASADKLSEETEKLKGELAKATPEQAPKLKEKIEKNEEEIERLRAQATVDSITAQRNFDAVAKVQNLNSEGISVTGPNGEQMTLRADNQEVANRYMESVKGEYNPQSGTWSGDGKASAAQVEGTTIDGKAYKGIENGAHTWGEAGNKAGDFSYVDLDGANKGTRGTMVSSSDLTEGKNFNSAQSAYEAASNQFGKGATTSGGFEVTNNGSGYNVQQRANDIVDLSQVPSQLHEQSVAQEFVRNWNSAAPAEARTAAANLYAQEGMSDMDNLSLDLFRSKVAEQVNTSPSRVSVSKGQKFDNGTVVFEASYPSAASPNTFVNEYFRVTSDGKVARLNR